MNVVGCGSQSCGSQSYLSTTYCVKNLKKTIKIPFVVSCPKILCCSKTQLSPLEVQLVDTINVLDDG